MTARFIPPYPPRPAKPVATWRGFFGERARTSVYGWSERAFEIDYLKRNILGFCGVRPIRHTLIGNVEGCSVVDRALWLRKLRLLGRRAT